MGMFVRLCVCIPCFLVFLFSTTLYCCRSEEIHLCSKVSSPAIYLYFASSEPDYFRSGERRGHDGLQRV